MQTNLCHTYGMEKNYIFKYIRNALILAFLLCLFVFVMDFLGIANDPDTGVILSSFIVSAYKNKTMNLMFSYPIKRQKILLSQILAVWIFNIIAFIITKLLMYSCVLLGSQFMNASFSFDFHMGSVDFYIQLILKSIVIVSMGFIALFVGMAVKSSKTTIITSFLLIFLTQANIGDFTLANTII